MSWPTRGGRVQRCERPCDVGDTKGVECVGSELRCRARRQRREQPLVREPQLADGPRHARERACRHATRLALEAARGDRAERLLDGR